MIWNDDLTKEMVKEFNCNNAEILAEQSDKATHVLQLATEFFTFKIKPFEIDDPTIFFSPYMLERMKSPGGADIKSSLVKYVTEKFDNDLKISLRAWELHQNKNYKYLNRQLILHKFVEKPRLVLESLKIDYPLVMRDVIRWPFSFILRKRIYNEKLQELRILMNKLLREKNEEMLHLRNDLVELVTYADENMVQLLNNFAQYFRLLWPIILSDLLQDDDIQEIKKKKMGIMTANFDMLKNYYVEAYELLGSILPLFLGIQNIQMRGDRNRFESDIAHEFMSIQSIIDYDKKMQQKGYKIKYFNKENIFPPLLDPSVLDNIIRNSIGHHSYDYEPDQQLIKFKDNNRNQELYLIEFGSMLYKTFLTTLAALEIIMFLKHELFAKND